MLIQISTKRIFMNNVPGSSSIPINVLINQIGIRPCFGLPQGNFRSLEDLQKKNTYGGYPFVLLSEEQKAMILTMNQGRYNNPITISEIDKVILDKIKSIARFSFINGYKIIKSEIPFLLRP